MFDKILIAEWRHGWKMFSVQANGLGAAIIAAYTALPSNFQSLVPSNIMLGITGFLFTVGIIGRLVHQDNVPASTDVAKEPPDGTQ